MLVNPLSPHDASKHIFTSLKVDLISLQLRGFRREISMKLFHQHMAKLTTFLIFYPLQVIFIHHKSRIATAIRGLWWMKMTVANSGLKGLLLGQRRRRWTNIKPTLVQSVPDMNV